MFAVAAAAEWLLRSGELERELLLEREEPEPGEEDLLSAAEEDVAEWEPPPTIMRCRSAESVRYWLSRIELQVWRRIASFVEKACLHLPQLMSDPPPPGGSCCCCG